jgi:flagellar hook-length control protein FliK
MQANLDQYNAHENRNLQAYYQAQPLHAELVTALVQNTGDNSVAPLTPTADLFQQVFDDALHQQGPQDSVWHTDDQAPRIGRDPHDSPREQTSPAAGSQASKRSQAAESYTPAEESNARGAADAPRQSGQQDRGTPAAAAGANAADSPARHDAAAQRVPGNGADAAAKAAGNGTDAAGKTAAHAADAPPNAQAATGHNAAKPSPSPAAEVTRSPVPAEELKHQALAAGTATLKQTLAKSNPVPDAQGPINPAGPEAAKPAPTPQASPPILSGNTGATSAQAALASKMAAAFQVPAPAKPATTGPAVALPTGVTAVTSGLAMADAQQAGPSPMPAPVTTSMSPGTPLTAQISQSLQTALRSNPRELVVQLFPVELGRIAIRFRQDGDQLVGLIQVSQRQVRADIEQAIPQILQNLEQSGTQVRRIDVEMQGEANGAPSETGTQDRETANPEARQRDASAQTEKQSPDEDEQESRTGRSADDAPRVISEADLAAGRVDMLL